MRACVVGGAGLIGSHLTDLLLERGHDVVILDNLDPAVHPLGRPPWVPSDSDFHVGDVQDEHLAKHVVAGCDVVFHLAAVGGFAPEPARMADTNCTGIARVMEACRHAGVSKVVVASSQAVYGHGVYQCPAHGRITNAAREPDLLRQGRWALRCPEDYRQFLEPAAAREDDPVAPTTAYALSKHFVERLALGLGAEWDMPVVALRYALTFGPRQSITNPYTGICSIFSTRLLAGNPPIVYEDGLQLRDFNYVEDVAAANLLAAEDDRADGRVLNVGTGIGTTVRAFVQLLTETYRELTGRPDLPEPALTGEYRPADARHLVTDPSALRALGWTPKVSLSEGLARYADWYLSQPRPRDGWWAASERLKEAGVVRTARPKAAAR